MSAPGAARPRSTASRREPARESAPRAARLRSRPARRAPPRAEGLRPEPLRDPAQGAPGAARRALAGALLAAVAASAGCRGEAPRGEREREHELAPPATTQLRPLPADPAGATGGRAAPASDGTTGSAAGSGASGGAAGGAPPRAAGPSRAPAATPGAAHVGQEIVVAGRAHWLGAPTITFRDAGGFDATLERCAFDTTRVLPRAPAPGCNEARRWAPRSTEPPDGRWTPERLAEVVDLVVVHYDVAWTSRNCFRVLHDVRGLSCHFLLDVDGTLYQTLDLTARARHAGNVNDRSVGIEIAHPGPLDLTPDLERRYTRAPDGGVLFDLGARASDVRAPGFAVRPARPDPIEGPIHGRTYRMYDYTDAQYETLARLFAALHRALPRVALDAPRDASGAVRTSLLAPHELADFRGVLGHFHVSAVKQDPGPAFDWERVLARARTLAGR